MVGLLENLYAFIFQNGTPPAVFSYVFFFQHHVHNEEEFSGIVKVDLFIEKLFLFLVRDLSRVIGAVAKRCDQLLSWPSSADGF